ncbi:MAG: hypothetical protein HHAS10_04610 [Candidatus Altimarinota bacterium]
MFSLPIFCHQGIYYLKIFPSRIEDDGMLMNSIKSDINSLWIPDLWFGLETYLFKEKGIVKIDQYVTSNNEEGLSYLINFFTKLYNKKCSFSTHVNTQLIQGQSYIHCYQTGLSSHGVLQIKKLGALGGDNFSTSSSIIGSTFQELLPFINDRDTVKVSFSFSKGSYSMFYKDYLYSSKSKHMGEEEKESFYKSFTDTQNFFSLRWSWEWNTAYGNTKNIIDKNLSLYSSSYNSYFLKEKKKIWDYIPSSHRLLQGEALLSQGLIIPLSNTFTENQGVPIVSPNVQLYQHNFIER